MFLLNIRNFCINRNFYTKNFQRFLATNPCTLAPSFIRVYAAWTCPPCASDRPPGGEQFEELQGGFHAVAGFPGRVVVVAAFEHAVAQCGQGGIEFAAFAFFHDDERDVPDVLLGVELVAAVTEHVDDLHQSPGLQLLQTRTDIGTRHPQGLGDFLRVQRPGVEVEEGVDLRHRAVHAPARPHLAPVEYEFLSRRGKLHSRDSSVSVITEIRER